MTVANERCLQEVRIGLKEPFQGFYTKAQREKAVQNTVMRYILHKLRATAKKW